MSFLSLTWNEGVFALRLDFARLRNIAMFRNLAMFRKPKPKKRFGPKPLPPPFPLPPLRLVEDNGNDDLLDAPALAMPTSPPPRRPSMQAVRKPSSPALAKAPRVSPPVPKTTESGSNLFQGSTHAGPTVIVDASLRQDESLDSTMLVDDDDINGPTLLTPRREPKTDLQQQRRDVRKALRRSSR